MARTNAAVAQPTPTDDTTGAPTTPAEETPPSTDTDADEVAALDAAYDEAVDEADLGPEADSESDDEAVEEAPVEEPAPTAPAPAEATPAATDVPADQPAPSAPAATEAAPQPTTPVPEPINPAAIQEQYTQWRTQAEDLLATQHYNLTPEQAEQLETDPAAAIPRLAARLHMEVLQQAVASAMRVVPQIMQNVQETQRQQSTRETEFFAEWPELRDHRDAVLQFGNAYYTQNPNATFADFKRDVGAMVAVAKKVDLSARVPVTPAQPAAAMAAPPPRPVAAGGGTRARLPAGPRNEFEEMDDLFDSENFR